jgi:sigma-B regulation protein RsbU (phosphoserine phosphatase)
VLSRVNRILLKDFPVAKFVTMIYALLDPRTRSVTFANAGHPPPIFVGPLQGEFLNTDSGTPLGIQEGHFTERNVEMSAGSRLVLYSDGVTEAMNISMKQYGEDRLLDHVSQAPATLQSIVQDVRSFTTGQHVSDDLTVMVVEST